MEKETQNEAQEMLINRQNELEKVQKRLEEHQLSITDTVELKEKVAELATDIATLNKIVDAKEKMANIHHMDVCVLTAHLETYREKHAEKVQKLTDQENELVEQLKKVEKEKEKAEKKIDMDALMTSSKEAEAIKEKLQFTAALKRKVAFEPVFTEAQLDNEWNRIVDEHRSDWMNLIESIREAAEAYRESTERIKELGQQMIAAKRAINSERAALGMGDILSHELTDILEKYSNDYKLKILKGEGSFWKGTALGAGEMIQL